MYVFTLNLYLFYKKQTMNKQTNKQTNKNFYETFKSKHLCQNFQSWSTNYNVLCTFCAVVIILSWGYNEIVKLIVMMAHASINWRNQFNYSPYFINLVIKLLLVTANKMLKRQELIASYFWQFLSFWSVLKKRRNWKHVNNNRCQSRTKKSFKRITKIK